MRRYLYIPTGRKLWFNVAVQLKKQGIAEPCAWIGDPKLDAIAKNQFPNCEVINLWAAINDLHNIQYEVESTQGFMERADLLEIRDRAFRMMDRRDPYGAYHAVDRDMTFYRTCLYAISSLQRWKPDFVQFIDAPHSVIHYLLYETAKHLQIPIWSFLPWSFAPVISLRPGIFGDPVKVAKQSPFEIRECIDDFMSRFRGQSADYDPYYMQRQKLIDQNNSRLKVKIYRGLIEPLKKAKSSFSEKSHQKKEVGLLSGSRLYFMEPLLRQFLVQKRRNALIQSLEKNKDDEALKLKEYVFFPLQYEPERTTLPDGMHYYDQCRTLIRLRELVPNHIPILIKEHYSQFTHALAGYKGRSPQFYNLTREIQNCHLVPVHSDPKTLIKNSMLTVAITGSAVLEAACMGKRGMFFGNPWFRGAPGVIQYRPEIDFDSIMKSPPANAEEVEIWLLNQFNIFGLFGCINPSNRKHFSKHYAPEGRNQHELDGIVNAIQQVAVFSDSNLEVKEPRINA